MCRAAEKNAISRSFVGLQSTGREREDCYTFEHFASRSDVIRTTYYYHYKKSILVLKEEGPWS